MKINIGFIIMVVGAISLLVGLTIYYQSLNNYTIEQIPCIDENNNEFVNQLCENKVYVEPSYTISMLLYSFGILGTLLGFFWSLFSCDKE